MKDFARHLINRHTQPESNISPRVRGWFEPETAGPGVLPFSHPDARARRPSHTGDEGAGFSNQESNIDAGDAGPAVEPEDPVSPSNPGKDHAPLHSPIPAHPLNPSKSPGKPGNSPDPRHSPDASHSKAAGHAESLADTGKFREQENPANTGISRRPVNEAGSDVPKGSGSHSITSGAVSEDSPSAVDKPTVRQTTDWRNSPKTPGQGEGSYPDDSPLPGEEYAPGDNSFPGRNQSGMTDPFVQDRRASLPDRRENEGRVLGDDPVDGKQSDASAGETMGLKKGGLFSRNDMGGLQAPGLPGQAGRSATAQDAKEEPVIKVTIGRIEVKAILPATPPPAKRREAPKPRLSLDDFLNQRKRSE
jgi:hypothetical protein